MGYSYDMQNRLCCDQCGKAEGTTRKRPCPSGYCPAVALCPECNHAVRHDGVIGDGGRRITWRAMHEYCDAKSEAFAAEEARRAALMRAGTPVRCAALGYHDGTGRVRVLFEHLSPDGQRVTTGADMDKATYGAIPLGTIATPADYRAHGAVLEAPATFEDVHEAIDRARTAQECAV